MSESPQNAMIIMPLADFSREIEHLLGVNIQPLADEVQRLRRVLEYDDVEVSDKVVAERLNKTPKTIREWKRMRKIGTNSGGKVTVKTLREMAEKLINKEV